MCMYSVESLICTIIPYACICNSTAVACIACMYVYVHRTCMHMYMHARSYSCSAKQHASTRKHNAATNIINFKHAPTDIDLE